VAVVCTCSPFPRTLCICGVPVRFRDESLDAFETSFFLFFFFLLFPLCSSSRGCTMFSVLNRQCTQSPRTQTQLSSTQTSTHREIIANRIKNLYEVCLTNPRLNAKSHLITDSLNRRYQDEVGCLISNSGPGLGKHCSKRQRAAGKYQSINKTVSIGRQGGFNYQFP
jgi:hypothetical protein